TTNVGWRGAYPTTPMICASYHCQRGWEDDTQDRVQQGCCTRAPRDGGSASPGEHFATSIAVRNLHQEEDVAYACTIKKQEENGSIPARADSLPGWNYFLPLRVPCQPAGRQSQRGWYRPIARGQHCGWRRK